MQHPFCGKYGSVLRCMKYGGIIMGFKKDFVWGAATAAYQIEGAYNEDG